MYKSLNYSFFIFIAKQNIFDSELYQKSSQTKDWLHYIEEKAKSLLSVNNYKALMKQIKDVSLSYMLLSKGHCVMSHSSVMGLILNSLPPLITCTYSDFSRNESILLLSCFNTTFFYFIVLRKR